MYVYNSIVRVAIKHGGYYIERKSKHQNHLSYFYIRIRNFQPCVFLVLCIFLYQNKKIFLQVHFLHILIKKGHFYFFNATSSWVKSIISLVFNRSMFIFCITYCSCFYWQFNEHFKVKAFQFKKNIQFTILVSVKVTRSHFGLCPFV